jgi:3-dehydroquinate synthase
MPSSFEVRASVGAYSVEVGSGLVGALLRRRSGAIVIVDERLRDRLPRDCTRVVALPATEEQKSLERMSEVVTALRVLQADRTSHVAAVGGGVIQDIATFVCSVYMRGIPWSYMPTTMLGMADSCIGGKSSINAGGVKNLVGNIYPPAEVVIDTDFVATLDAAQTIGGLIEAAKICFARGYDTFRDYEALGPTYPLSPEHAEVMILRSLNVKRWFIEIDEHDKKERLLLNYGHTFGHALEAATDFAIPHGLAVGAGVIAANVIATRSGWLTPRGEAAARHMQEHMVCMIAAADARPAQALPLDRVLAKFESDKKHVADSYRIVAPERDGALTLVPMPKSAAVREVLAAGIADACALLKWPYQAA